MYVLSMASTVRLRSILALALASLIQMPLPLVTAANTHRATGTTSKSRSSAPLAPQADLIRQVPLTANDVVYSSATQMLYASVPSSAGPGGNSITTVDPATTGVVSSVFVGSEPDKLALSDNGHTLYTWLAGGFSMRKFEVVTQTAGLSFLWDKTRLLDDTV